MHNCGDRRSICPGWIFERRIIHSRRLSWRMKTSVAGQSTLKRRATQERKEVGIAKGGWRIRQERVEVFERSRRWMCTGIPSFVPARRHQHPLEGLVLGYRSWGRMGPIYQVIMVEADRCGPARSHSRIMSTRKFLRLFDFVFR